MRFNNDRNRWLTVLKTVRDYRPGETACYQPVAGTRAFGVRANEEFSALRKAIEH